MAEKSSVNGDAAPAPATSTNKKRTPDQYTRNFDLNEISPLRKTPTNGDFHATTDTDGLTDDGKKTQVRVNMASTTNTTAEDDTIAGSIQAKSKNKFKGTYHSVLTHLEISEKARLPFLIVIGLCVLLLMVVIVLLAFWPRIPFYMRADICVDKECMDSSSQILLWANTSVDACDSPYAWACGRFEQEFHAHRVSEFFGREWNVRTHSEYEEIRQIHSFVAQLPMSASSSAQLMVKRLHSDCMKMHGIDKMQADFTVEKAISALSGWVFGRDWSINAWDLRQAVVVAHSRYGLSPFFKISIQNRNAEPFGNIITISEGSLGLPHQYFYNLGSNHRITNAYKMLMRDFAIHLGTVAETAKKFAELVYHFELRVVNDVLAESYSATMTLGALQKLVPSLPIYETITTTFSNTKIDENTMLYVEDVGKLKDISTIVSTSEYTALNSFITWSLSRHFLPFMSSDYRAALEAFESVLYGDKSAPPVWYECAKLLRDWVPFALDALRHNPELIVAYAIPQPRYTTICKCITYFDTNDTTVESSTALNNNRNSNNSLHINGTFNQRSAMANRTTILNLNDILDLDTTSSSTAKNSKTSSNGQYDKPKYASSNALVSDRTNYDHELVKMIFYHLRQQFRKAIDDNVEIDQDVTNFINDKMSQLQLQIGIPAVATKTDAFVNGYYKEFLYSKMNFIDHLESRWSFERRKIEDQLVAANRTDKLIAHLFPIVGQRHRLVQYSVDLNTVIVSEQAVHKPHFHHKYPIAVNFARIGAELSSSLLDAALLFGEQYTVQLQAKRPANSTKLPKFCLADASCLENKIRGQSIPMAAKHQLSRSIASGQFAAKAFAEFQRMLDANDAIAELSDTVTFDLFGLRQSRRQPGLRVFDDTQLFGLALMQRHCGRDAAGYAAYKAFIDKEISEREIFDITWAEIAQISTAMYCSAAKPSACSSWL